ncbi:peptidoglycan bridge formation glycyltransferase FemA/FemB family protein [Candidatus Gottesmanbacteria bacterium]|nr:peptidoglycan bridge formation glycyltransferase FemA/FemB family protein [Candidatus Gottesmanbacteria bacterium]
MKKTDRTIHDKAATHPLQSWAWGEFRKNMGVDVVRVNGWQLTFHTIPHTPFTVGYSPKGPMPTKAMLATLVKLARQKNAIFIQLEPNVICHCEPRLGGAWQSPTKTEIASLIARNDKQLKPSHHPLFTEYTFILDLTKSEEELMKAMHPKTRYNIRVAQKHGVTVQEDNSGRAFEEYLRLTAETTARQGFYAHNQQYHRMMWQIMSKAGIAHLFTANYQGATLAAWIIFAWKDTIYYPYGASSREHREVMAPALLLWEIARWGKRQGYQTFDLWGALGPPPAGGHDPQDPWYGFHRFKEGFNPDIVEFIGSYDLVLRPILYRLYCIADTIRWKILHINMLTR